MSFLSEFKAIYLLSNSTPNDSDDNIIDFVVNNISFGSTIIIPSNSEVAISSAYRRGIVLVKTRNIPQFIDIVIIIGTPTSINIPKNIPKGISKVYISNTNNTEVICGKCNEKTTKNLNNDTIKKYCSMECSLNDQPGFLKMIQNSIKDYEEPKPSNKILTTEIKGIILTDDPEKKYQKNMMKEAKRLEYANRREEFKRQMKQRTISGSRNTVQKKKIIRKACKAITQKGKKCTNKSIGTSDYCGIDSHCSDLTEQI